MFLIYKYITTGMLSLVVAVGSVSVEIILGRGSIRLMIFFKVGYVGDLQ
jgi:hypothetical protein